MKNDEGLIANRSKTFKKKAYEGKTYFCFKIFFNQAVQKQKTSLKFRKIDLFRPIFLGERNLG